MSKQFDQQNHIGINGENAIYEEKKCDETEVKEQTKQDRVPAGCGCVAIAMIPVLIGIFIMFAFTTTLSGCR